MSAPHLLLALLGVGGFGIATALGPRFDELNARRGGGFMGSLFGESRKLFAHHFFTRSDVYFHSGYYPSIFDQAGPKKENHLAEKAGAKEKQANPAHGEAGHAHHEGEEHEEHEEKSPEAKGHVHDERCQHGDEEDFLGKPKDRMDAFTRHFFVSQHTHLTEKGSNAPKEILPWIQLAAKLDPQKLESYTVGAYWLRQLDKKEEAEQFLREGLRQNPQSFEIMLELGRSYQEKRDFDRARNVLEMGFRRWREQENSKPVEQQDRFAAAQILNNLALIEDQTGHRQQAINWLQIVKKISPHPEAIEQRISEVRAGQPLKAD